MDQLKKQFSGRQKSQSPEENAATTKPAAITLNMTASQIQGGASVIAKLTAAVAQQVSVELEYNGYLNRERECVRACRGMSVDTSRHFLLLLLLLLDVSC